jgi:hypothetical protein
MLRPTVGGGRVVKRRLATATLRLLPQLSNDLEVQVIVFATV